MFLHLHVTAESLSSACSAGAVLKRAMNPTPVQRLPDEPPEQPGSGSERREEPSSSPRHQGSDSDGELVQRLVARIAELEAKLYQHELSEGAIHVSSCVLS